MKIAIEAQRIFRPNKHGMDFVALETIRCLQRLDTKNEYFIFTGEGEDRCLEESPNMHITTLRCPSYPLWEQWALPRAVARVKPDLLHCTSNTAPVWGNAPLILTLHDIIFLEQQAARNKSLYQSLGRVYRRLVVPRILPRCRMVITVSQFECDRIRTALNFDPGRIMAIHNGYNDRFRPMEGTAETVRKYLRDPEYLFFLGNTDPKKNTPGTLKAYAEYVRRSENPLPLLVADLGEQPAEAILREIGEPRLRGMLRLAGYIPNSDLPAIYNRASAFLYTSLRESFGIPQLEAMACGTPVVTSATSAIPEVAGEGKASRLRPRTGETFLVGKDRPAFADTLRIAREVTRTQHKRLKKPVVRKRTTDTSRVLPTIREPAHRRTGLRRRKEGARTCGHPSIQEVPCYLFISSSPGIARPRANTNPAILHRPTAPNRPSRDKPSGNPPSHRHAGYHGEC